MPAVDCVIAFIRVNQIITGGGKNYIIALPGIDHIFTAGAIDCLVLCLIGAVGVIQQCSHHIISAFAAGGKQIRTNIGRKIILSGLIKLVEECICYPCQLGCDLDRWECARNAKVLIEVVHHIQRIIRQGDRRGGGRNQIICTAKWLELSDRFIINYPVTVVGINTQKGEKQCTRPASVIWWVDFIKDCTGNWGRVYQTQCFNGRGGASQDICDEITGDGVWSNVQISIRKRYTVALLILRAGVFPDIIGWITFPAIDLAGTAYPNPDIFFKTFHRLVKKCAFICQDVIDQIIDRAVFSQFCIRDLTNCWNRISYSG